MFQLSVSINLLVMPFDFIYSILLIERNAVMLLFFYSTTVLRTEKIYLQKSNNFEGIAIFQHKT